MAVDLVSGNYDLVGVASVTVTLSSSSLAASTTRRTFEKEEKNEVTQQQVTVSCSAKCVSTCRKLVNICLH